MLLLGDKKEMILLLRHHRSKRYHLCCIGRKRHYRKDGTCKHTEGVLAKIKPRIRKTVIVNGWGGKVAMRERRADSEKEKKETI